MGKKETQQKEYPKIKKIHKFPMQTKSEIWLPNSIQSTLAKNDEKQKSLYFLKKQTISKPNFKTITIDKLEVESLVQNKSNLLTPVIQFYKQKSQSQINVQNKNEEEQKASLTPPEDKQNIVIKLEKIDKKQIMKIKKANKKLSKQKFEAKQKAKLSEQTQNEIKASTKKSSNEREQEDNKSPSEDDNDSQICSSQSSQSKNSKKKQTQKIKQKNLKISLSKEGEHDKPSDRIKISEGKNEKRKPGRPKKQPINNQERKPGRPKKVLIDNEKRKPGRPRKQPIDQEQSQLETPQNSSIEKEKRKPGRPRKLSLNKKIQSKTPKNISIEKEKRKPGRLRKQSIDEEKSQLETPQNLSIEKEKRKRGRPRKLSIDQEQSELETPQNLSIEKEKRKPGRPRKLSLNKEQSELETPQNLSIEKEKRKPGRPRKIFIIKEQRRPGKPRKIIINKEKRRPGRPRKILVEEDQIKKMPEKQVEPRSIFINLSLPKSELLSNSIQHKIVEDDQKKLNFNESILSQIQIRKPMILQKLHDNEKNKKNEKYRIVVEGISTNSYEGDIKQLFLDCGLIKKVKLTNKKKINVAIIQFLQKGSLQKALTKNGTVYMSKTLTIYQENDHGNKRKNKKQTQLKQELPDFEQDQKDIREILNVFKQESQQVEEIKLNSSKGQIDNVASPHLIVSGFTQQASYKQIKTLFSKYGNVISCHITPKTNPITPKNADILIDVEYETLLMAQKARKSLNDQNPEERKIKVEANTNETCKRETSSKSKEKSGSCFREDKWKNGFPSPLS